MLLVDYRYKRLLNVGFDSVFTLLYINFTSNFLWKNNKSIIFKIVE